MNSYSHHFTSADAAAEYDAREYAPGTYASLMSEIEGEVVKGLSSDNPTPCRALDFACGTGRMTRQLPETCDPLFGVDISQEMIDRATTQGGRAQYLQLDILADPIENASELGKFDCITAFRFILNAEPALRSACLSKLASSYIEPDGRLIVNNHGNRYSHHLVSCILSAVRLRPANVTGNTLSHRATVKLLQESGFEVKRRIGYGVLGSRAASLLGARRARTIERAFHRSFGRTPLGLLGGHQMYLASAST